MWISPVSLNDEQVTLQPLNVDHLHDLQICSDEGELWKLWYTTIPTSSGMKEEIDRRLSLRENGSMVPFTVMDNASGRAVGMTTYMNVDSANRRLEIGSTWYAKFVQRTGVNTRSKLLLLDHAFEKLNCNAVEFRTHFFNQQSRTAIERLGAKLDGTLRNHMIMANGTLRDTCVYSILSGEWPTVKAHLTHQISKYEG